MNEILAVFAVAVLFAAFGLFYRPREGVRESNTCQKKDDNEACAACERMCESLEQDHG